MSPVEVETIPQMPIAIDPSAILPPVKAILCKGSLLYDFKHKELLKPVGFVGFSNYPNQAHRKSIQQGFYLNILVIGQSGIGKLDLLKSLFSVDNGHHHEGILLQEEEDSVACDDNNLHFKRYFLNLKEHNVHFRINITVTNGFGDYADNATQYDQVLKEIVTKIDHYYYEENNIYRGPRPVDSRYHACLYFLPSWSSKLSNLDIITMKKIDALVNLIPVIAKSDLLTLKETQMLKNKIRACLHHYQINIFLPSFDPYDDEFYAQEVNNIKKKFPLAVISKSFNTKDRIKVNGHLWSNPVDDDYDISDLMALKQVLISDYCLELKDKTDKIYRNYKLAKFQDLKANALPLEEKEKIKDFLLDMPKKLLDYEKKLKDELHLHIMHEYSFLKSIEQENQFKFEKDYAELRKLITGYDSEKVALMTKKQKEVIQETF